MLNEQKTNKVIWKMTKSTQKELTSSLIPKIKGWEKQKKKL